MRTCTRATSYDRVSLSTPEEGTSIHDLRDKKKGMHKDKRTSIKLTNEQHHNSWLSEKLKECGKFLGISVDINKGGWNNLYDFAHRKEQENREAYAMERTKRKGSRELQSFACSIKYEEIQPPGSRGEA